MTSTAKFQIEHGNKYPYDASDDWWKTEGVSAPKPKDCAHRAARGVMCALSDRRGIKWELENVDQDCREEMVKEVADVIRLASAEAVA